MLIELLGGKCAKCQSKRNLEFDHINKSEKKFGISEKWSYSIRTVLKEVAKCQLLCHRCHTDKNKKDNGEAHHGGLTMYRHHHCRCDACRNAYNTARKKWRHTAKLKLQSNQ